MYSLFIASMEISKRGGIEFFLSIGGFENESRNV